MATKFDAVAASELRDTQGEILDVKGADISELVEGRGVVNDNHSNKLPDVVGRITEAKKIFGPEDCENERQKYYWNKIKAPYIYTAGILYDDEDHRSAKAAAAIIKHQFKTDSPLKLKCSVEGGIVERGQKDQRVLKRTKIRGLALTLTPANNATLVEGLDLVKSAPTVEELDLVKSYVPHAIVDVPALVDLSKRTSIAKIRENVEKIYEVIESLKKNISLTQPLEKASKKQLLQQLGPDPKAAEVADWLSKDVKRDDVQQWFVRNYKKNPSIYNNQNKQAVRHYVGTAGIHQDKDIGKIRFDNSHSFEDGMKMWEDAERQLQSQTKGAHNLVKPDEKTKKLIDLGNGWGWYDLGKGYDAAEGKAMSHCGNVEAEGAGDDPSHPRHHDRILSLRKEHNINGEIYHEPRLSFIENQGFLGETKGFGNSKPAAKYHDAIVELLKHPRIKENIGGGYLPNNNFHLNDLPKDKLDKLLKDKPNLERLWLFKSHDLDPEDYPEKHKQDVAAHNNAVNSHLQGDVENVDVARFRDIDSSVAKEIISDAIKNIREDNKRYFTTAPTYDENFDNDEPYPDISHDTHKLGSSLAQSPHLDASHVDSAFQAGSIGILTNLLSSHAANKSHIDRALKDKDGAIRMAAADSPHFKSEHMDQALNDPFEGVRQAAVKSRHFKPEHMDRALNDKNEIVRHYALKSPAFKPEHMDRVFNHEDASVRRAAVESPHFQPEHMDQALNDEDASVRRAAVESPHFQPEHMDQAFNDEDAGVRQAAIVSSHSKPEYVDKALNDENWLVRHYAVKSPAFKPEHMDRALNDSDENVRDAAVESPHFGPEHMDRALNDSSEYVRRTAVESPHFKPEHMDMALSNKDEHVRRSAVKSPAFKPEHMDMALNHEYPDVRRSAVESPHFKPEHMDMALSNKDDLVRDAAVRSPAFKPEHMDMALNHEYPNVRRSAVVSPHFKPEHMDRALNDSNENVRDAAVRSRHFGPEHMDRALNDSSKYIRHAAVDSPHFKPEHMDKALNDSSEYVRNSAMKSPHYQTYLKQKDLSKSSKISKALTAGYGGAEAPNLRTGGSVLQSETLDQGRSFRYIDCPNCGKEQVYMSHQTKCRSCNKSFPFDTLVKFFISNNR